jgi:hypothetical protein
MPRIIDDLKYIATGREPETQIYIYDPVFDDACHFCAGEGLFSMFCPYCGKWDHRSELDLEDDVLLAEAGE